MSKKIFLVAGEPSGDLHASSLASEIRKIDPGVSLKGIGGEHMAGAGVTLFYRTDEFAIIGIADVLKHLSRIREMFFLFLAKAEEEKPGLVILVDYPGFNLRLAGELKKRGIKVIYYISPQVWAWGGGRIQKIKRCVEKIIVFFKFEAELYKKAGVPVEFVGHPLLDRARPSSDKNTVKKNLRLDDAKKTIILLPGSRKCEVAALLPVMAEASKKLYEKSKDIQFIVVRPGNLQEGVYKEYLKGLEAPYRIVEGAGSKLYDCLSVSDVAIAASGTVTLECAIMNVPMVITYKVSLLNAIVMRLFMRISMIGLVNIIAGRKIVPELVQFDCTADRIFVEVSKILFQAGESERVKEELAKVKHSLGAEGASRRAALSIFHCHCEPARGG